MEALHPLLELHQICLVVAVVHMELVLVQLMVLVVVQVVVAQE
jgi:hypothetical protein